MVIMTQLYDMEASGNQLLNLFSGTSTIETKMQIRIGPTSLQSPLNESLVLDPCVGTNSFIFVLT